MVLNLRFQDFLLSFYEFVYLADLFYVLFLFVAKDHVVYYYFFKVFLFA